MGGKWLIGEFALFPSGQERISEDGQTWIHQSRRAKLLSKND